MHYHILVFYFVLNVARPLCQKVLSVEVHLYPKILTQWTYYSHQQSNKSVPFNFIKLSESSIILEIMNLGGTLPSLLSCQPIYQHLRKMNHFGINILWKIKKAAVEDYKGRVAKLSLHCVKVLINFANLLNGLEFNW